MLVKTLRRRFPEEVHKTNIVLIDCRASRDPASSALRNHGSSSDHALQDSESSQVPRFVAGFGLSESYVLPTKSLKQGY